MAYTPAAFELIPRTCMIPPDKSFFSLYTLVDFTLSQRSGMLFTSIVSTSMRSFLFVISVLISTGCHHAVTKEATTLQPEERVSALSLYEQRNPHGIFFSADKFTDVYIKNVGTVAAYQFTVTRAPPGQKFSLSAQPLGGDVTVYAEYDVDDDGTLGRQVNEGTMMLNNELICMFDFWRAEPVDYWLISKDGSTVLKTTLVPYPIQTQGRDGAKITLRRLIPSAHLMLCEGEGFLPDEKIFATAQSVNQVAANVPLFCTNGKFSLLLEPAGKASSGGKAFLEIRRFSERLIVDYDWGCEATNDKRKIACSLKMDSDALVKLSQESATETWKY